jgi:hypothetical protein
MLTKFLVSLGLTILVSVLAGLLVISKFWIVFSLTFIVQVLFFYFFNSIYENKLIEKAQLLKIQELKEATKNVATLACPCDEKVKQNVDVRLDTDVVYQCAKCKKNIKAVVNVKTIQTTDPIYFND